MRTWLAALALGSSVMVAGCAADSASVASSDQDVTEIPETSVKEQTIGNCWIYATLGWVESLHAGHTGEQLDLSESYLTYLAAFSRLTTDRFVFSPSGEWNTGDFFGQGAELIARYGLIDEATFIATEATASRSARQEQANRVIMRELRPGGRLATVEQRRDPANVRAVLDDAFALPDEVSAMMTRAFGEDLSRTRGNGATLDERFRDPATMIVATLKDGHEVTLDEALGELDPDRVVGEFRDRRERRGPYAWERVEYGDADARAEAVLRLKKALNAGFPVPIAWYPAFGSMSRDDGSFDAPVRGDGGWHLSLVHDYQIDVPGHGVLPVGVPVHDPALLEATLDPAATIQLVRMKNSWGRESGPLGARGYTDASWDYLNFEFSRPHIDYDETVEPGVAVSAFTLPPASWDGATH